MKHDINLDMFRQLKSQAVDVLALRHQAQEVLQRRPLRSFDGFGHFLDAVLGEDPERLTALARTVRLSNGTIDQLRASELDPFATSFEDVAYLGYLLGLDGGEFSHLVNIDHSRFARHAESVFARSGEGSSVNAVDRVEQLWHRFAEDRATDL